ncbi:MAG: ABC transporter ATP-binding protein [Nanoarchaeota archaeon]|nr:ABC transporter ATP-binding protein [Nanoarchaeota archaeon]
MTLLDFRGIKKSFGKREVLKDLSFSVEEGEILGVIGESGGGKSTLFSILTGFLESDSGSILFQGKIINKNSNNYIAKIGFATQSDRIIEELTVGENCFYFGSLMGLKKKEVELRMKELLLFLKLENSENILVKNLSGGMAKRTNILVSLIHNPPLLILDEPTTGLDPLLRKKFWEYIHQIKNRMQTTVLVASHLLDEIEENCDRIVFLKDGRIIASGSPAQFRNTYKLPLQKIFELISQNEDN